MDEKINRKNTREMIDTHIHLDDEKYAEDLCDVIARAQAAGVEKMLVPSVNMASVKPVTDVCRRYSGYAFPMLGLHPEDVRDDYRQVIEQMKAIGKREFCPAPGGASGGDALGIGSGGDALGVGSGVGLGADAGAASGVGLGALSDGSGDALGVGLGALSDGSWGACGVDSGDASGIGSGDADGGGSWGACGRLSLVGIGEIGLDYYWSREYEKEQLDAFAMQIEWAIESDLPLMLHVRKAQNEAVRLLRSYRKDLKRGGVFHCFSGNTHEAAELLDLEGFMLGIGGILTFKKSTLPATLAEAVPLNRIVLETDGPYLAPVPMRGKRNESEYLVHVAERLAEVYGVDTKTVDDITTSTAKKVFRLGNE